MNNYKITIQYDGTRYKGWQGQNSTGLTIQGERMRAYMPKARWQIFILRSILRRERSCPI